MKKIFSIPVVVMFIMTVFVCISFASTADQSVVICNTDMSPVAILPESGGIIVKSDFTAPFDGNAKVIAAKYKTYDALSDVEILDNISMKKGEKVSIVSKAVSVDDSDTVKIYIWGGESTVKPVLNVPAVIQKQGVTGAVSKFTNASDYSGTYVIKTSVKLGEIFESVENSSLPVKSANVQVFGDGSFTYVPDKSDWTNGTVEFDKPGTVNLTVTDYSFCVPFSTSVTIKEPDPVAKFEVKADADLTYTEGDTVKAGDIFSAIDGVKIDTANVAVTSDSETATVVKADNWAESTVTFNGVGEIKLTITDNYYCIPTEATVTVEYKPTEKFAKADTALEIYTLGDVVTLGDLFNAIEGVEPAIKADAIKVTTANATYTANADWTLATVAFDKLGEATVEITDGYYCIPTSIAVTVKEPDPVAKFEVKADADLTYTKGDTVKAGDIFSAIDGVKIDTENVAVTSNSETATVVKADNWAESTVTFNGVGEIKLTITDNYYCIPTEATVTVEYKPTEKFAKADTALEEYTLGDVVTLGDLFNAIEGVEPAIKADAIKVTATNATYTANADWTLATVAFDKLGEATVEITDGYYCIPTSIAVTVKEPDPVAKFASKFNKNSDFIYRVGNKNDVSAGSLFKALDGAEISSSNVVITVDNVSGNASGVPTPNTSDWTAGTIRFAGAGLVNVTITDNDYCIAESITLEVITATNATGATNAATKDVVLLNDVGFSSLEISGGHTLYGNGFKLTCSSDSYALDTSYSFITLNNGTIDNAQIICPNFSHAVLYSSDMTSSSNQSYTDANGKVRYYNVKSAIIATGNNTIANSYISGGRACVYATSGTTLIDNTTIKGGAVANIQIGAALSGLTLRDATLIQVPTQANVNDTSKTLLGFSVLAMTDDAGVGAPITLEGNLTQYAWIDKSDEQYIPSAGSTLVDMLLSQTDYLHTIDGVSSLNSGIVYMASNQGEDVSDQSSNVIDNRTNKDNIPYGWVEVDLWGNTIACVYSVKNTNGTDPSLLTEPEFTPSEYEATPMEVTYTDTNENRVFSREFEAVSGWTNKLMVNLDAGAYSFSFANLKVMIGGVEASYTVRDASGNTVDKSQAVTPAVGNINYTLVVTDPATSQTREASFVLGATMSEINSPELVASNYEDGLCVASSYGGTWHGAAPALQGIQIKYWSAAESQYKTITLSDYTPTTAGKQNGTNNTWTYTPANGDFTLTLTGGQVHSSNNVYAMPVVCDGKLYFVAASSNGLVNTGNSARTIPVSYSFKDNATDTALTFSHTWSVEENKDAEYSYSDFCNGTLTKLEAGGSSGGNCVTPETLITLADGSKKEVQYLTGEEELLVWNLETGAYDKAPIVFIDSDDEAEFDVVTLSFDDGSETELIYEHGYFDLDLAKYVYITKDNAEDFIGHSFVACDDINTNTWKELVLTDVTVEKRLTGAYSPVTFAHLCYYVDGVLSMPGGIEGLFNIFEVDTSIMTYDAQKMSADIGKYGLFEYSDFEQIISEDVYEAFNGDWLKVSIGKGSITWEKIEELAKRYAPLC